MSNYINRFTTIDDLQIESICENVRESLRHNGDGNACLIICTNGVYKKEENGQKFEILTMNKNPDTAATALFNQAIQMNDLHNIQELIAHLRRIADCAEENINFELQRRQKQN